MFTFNQTQNILFIFNNYNSDSAFKTPELQKRLFFIYKENRNFFIQCLLRVEDEEEKRALHTVLVGHFSASQGLDTEW